MATCCNLFSSRHHDNTYIYRQTGSQHWIPFHSVVRSLRSQIFHTASHLNWNSSFYNTILQSSSKHLVIVSSFIEFLYMQGTICIRLCYISHLWTEVLFKYYYNNTKYHVEWQNSRFGCLLAHFLSFSYSSLEHITRLCFSLVNTY